ncbi:hypothetical protein RDV78_04535 [Bacillota bacterium LX-D]|nr:hypothetical protein [Bacillota bacterium LX-D]
MMTSRVKIYYYKKSNIHGGKENKLHKIEVEESKLDTFLRHLDSNVQIASVYKVTYDEIKKADTSTLILKNSNGSRTNTGC